MQKASVILVDDHAVVRAGLAALLKELDDIEIVGQASSGQEALELMKQHLPDVVLLGLSLSEMRGLEATERIHQAYPPVKVVILSLSSSQDFLEQALQAGASGYLGKGVNPGELETAMRTVLAGNQYLSATNSPEDQQKTDTLAAQARQLTPRQRQVLEFIAQGYTSREIAKALGISFKTVQAHREQLRKRLHIHDTARLVSFAIQAGLVPGRLKANKKYPGQG